MKCSKKSIEHTNMMFIKSACIIRAKSILHMISYRNHFISFIYISRISIWIKLVLICCVVPVICHLIGIEI